MKAARRDEETMAPDETIGDVPVTALEATAWRALAAAPNGVATFDEWGALANMAGASMALAYSSLLAKGLVRRSAGRFYAVLPAGGAEKKPGE